MSTDFTPSPTVRVLKNTPPEEPVIFKGFFLIKKNTVRTARNGSEYIMLEVADATGSFVFNAFYDSIAFNVCKGLAEGSIIEIEGQTDYYQDRFSPKVHNVILFSMEQAQEMGVIQRLIECSLEDPVMLWEEFNSYIKDISQPELQTTVRLAIGQVEDIFKMSAAAISMHHAYRYGLLEHTVHMARAAKALLPLYREVNPDLCIAGILLHDIGKALEYSTQLTVKKTRIGILQGHVVLGYRIVRRAALQANLNPSLAERLEHIILSHQGELEWGAAVMAATPEAVFVSMIDNLDAKMGVIQYALRNPHPEKEFSDYSPALKSSVLTIPVEDR